MRLPCNVIEDLLPLYHDGVCSEESKNLVEEHLKECASCKDVLHTLKEETAPDRVNAAKPLDVIRKEWKKGMKKALLKGFLTAVLICAVLIGAFVAATQWRFIEISTFDMEIAEIYQLKDGRILYRLDVPNNVYCRDFRFETTEDGCNYIIPVRPLIDTTQITGYESYLDDWLMLDHAENNAYQKATGGPHITKWYLGSPGFYSTLLIYEEGMDLEPAPAELEARFGIG